MNITWTTGYCEYDILDNSKNKVTHLHWKCVAEDGGEEAQAVGSINTADQNRVYTIQALENVPNHVMTTWVHQAMGDEEKEAVEAAVAAQVAALITPNTGGLEPVA